MKKIKEHMKPIGCIILILLFVLCVIGGCYQYGFRGGAAVATDLFGAYAGASSHAYKDLEREKEIQEMKDRIDQLEGEKDEENRRLD